MSFVKRAIVPIYMILNGLSAVVPTALIIAFSITLFEQDPSGVSAAYLELAILLGICCAGLFGGFFLKRFGIPTVGMLMLACASCILCYTLFAAGVGKQACTLTLWALACVMSIEHANGLAFINKQLGAKNKAFYFSNFQTFLQLFNVLAPIGTKNALAAFGVKAVVLFCISTYLIRLVLWGIIRSMEQPDIPKSTTHSGGVLTGFKEIIRNTGLFCMTVSRILNHIATIAYVLSLPIFAAKMAQGNPQVNAQLYSYSMSSMNVGFIFSGLLGSFCLKKRPRWVIFFFRSSPILIVASVFLSFYAKQPTHLFSTSVLYGMGLYLSKTANSIIGQALTQKEKLAQVILAGDATVKIFAYAIGSLVPCLILLPPAWHMFPPFLGGVACSLFSLGMVKSIAQIYFDSLDRDLDRDRT